MAAYGDEMFKKISSAHVTSIIFPSQSGNVGPLFWECHGNCVLTGRAVLS